MPTSPPEFSEQVRDRKEKTDREGMNDAVLPLLVCRECQDL